MQHTVAHCKTLQHTAIHCSTLQDLATHCNTLQHTLQHSKTHTATQCKTHRNTLQHTASHCNTHFNTPGAIGPSAPYFSINVLYGRIFSTYMCITYCLHPILWNCVGSRSYELKKNLDKTNEAELICYPPLHVQHILFACTWTRMCIYVYYI